MLKLVILRKLPSHVGYHMIDSQEIVHPNRFPNGNFGTSILPTSARESKKAMKVGGDSMQMQSVKTTCEAMDILKSRLQQGIAIDSYMFAEVLQRCLKQEDLTAVKQVHECIIESGMQQNIYVANNLLIVYIRCGRLKDAGRVFDELRRKDIISWNVMIGGYAQHSRAKDAVAVFNQMRQEDWKNGCGSEASDVFRNMKAAGVKPNGYSFAAVLTACSHAGLVDEGRRLFQAMSQEYGIVPSVLHWTCMVDILGRAGHLEEAKLLIDNMPVEPDGAIWGALLGACRSYGNVELGEVVANERAKLEPNDASLVVILSNIYAAADQGEKVSLVRTMMQERGMYKEPGRSCIEVDGGYLSSRNKRDICGAKQFD